MRLSSYYDYSCAAVSLAGDCCHGCPDRILYEYRLTVRPLVVWYTQKHACYTTESPIGAGLSNEKSNGTFAEHDKTLRQSTIVSNPSWVRDTMGDEMADCCRHQHVDEIQVGPSRARCQNSPR
ncbi:unnamed protein product [Ectocarpus sp. 12 AP-2014]